MPRSKHKLTAKQVEHAQPGRHGDGNGLSLLVKPTGSRSWTARVTVDGKRRDIGLGAWPAVSLAAARDRNAEVQAEARSNGDPTRARRTATAAAPTFEAASREWHAIKSATWRNPKTARQWIGSMERHVFPKLATVPVDRITTADVLAVLEPIWTEIAETAGVVQERMAQVFDRQRALGNVEHNPAAKSVVTKGLPKQNAGEEHHPAVPWREVPAVHAAVDGSTRADSVKLCLRFTILTAARGIEARQAMWSEIDFAAAERRIPAERMKRNKPHTVALSPQAIDTLRKAEALDDGSGWVFPSPMQPGRPLSHAPALKLLHALGIEAVNSDGDRVPATVHGFRSSFMDWADEMSYPEHITDAALAHAHGSKTRRSYARSELVEQRRPLMAEWAKFVTS